MGSGCDKDHTSFATEREQCFVCSISRLRLYIRDVSFIPGQGVGPVGLFVEPQNFLDSFVKVSHDSKIEMCKNKRHHFGNLN